MKEGFSQLHKILKELKVDAPLFLTQNNGSLIEIDRAMEYPLLTLSSGPTNSFIGAGRLAEERDAIVIDIGGTSTDIGCIQNGYPRRSMHHVCFGGVSLNFRTPDVLALSIGGGSVVSGLQVGPESCGSQLKSEAQIFGGNILTLTDIASKAGIFAIADSDVDRVELSEREAKHLLDHVRSQILKGVEKMRGKHHSLPIIGVGGGAAIAGHLVNSYFEHQAVANAYGAALAEISATIDTVISLTDRERQLNNLKESVFQQAVEEGAESDSVRIVDLQVIPYHYVPNQLARVVVTASGKKVKNH